MAINENFSPDPWEENSYGTGSTRPPKKRGGWIAVFFAGVIFLTGISTAMGLMNIRFSFVPEDDAQESVPSVLFAQENTLPAAGSITPSSDNLSPGFTGQALSVREQIIYKLPRGIYITQVHRGSDAQVKGISPGDVLVRLGKIATPDIPSLTAALKSYHSGDEVEMVIDRGGARYTVRVILSQEK